MTLAIKSIDAEYPRTRTSATYLDKPEHEAQRAARTAHGPIRPRAQSLWLLAQLSESRPEVTETAASLCGDVLSNLRHFNIRRGFSMSPTAIPAHCDFHSAPLPELTTAWKGVLDALRLWAEALNQDVATDEIADITYADVDYPPRSRNYLDVEVRIVPNATRVKRVYTDEDAEVWGP
jgi:hypothetical protein